MGNTTYGTHGMDPLVAIGKKAALILRWQECITVRPGNVVTYAYIE